MMIPRLAWLACSGTAAFLVTWIIVGLLSRKALKIGLMDRPNERSSHTRATPRGGGIGFVTAWSGGCIFWWLWQRDVFMPGSRLGILLLCTMVISGISFWDDYRSVRAGPRFALHLICSAAIISTFGWFEQIDSGLIVPWLPLSLTVTIIWIVGLTNVYNFMDGIDGLAGLQGVVAGLAWCIAGEYLGLLSISIIGAMLAGGCAGFLIHNWAPATIFMGDVGSAFLGFVFGALPLVALRDLAGEYEDASAGRLPVFALLVVWPFVADGSFTFFRRLLKFEPIFKPHRSHLYQRLVQAGWSHSTVAFFYGVWSIVCGLAGLFYLENGMVSLAIGIAVLFFTCTWSLTLHSERRKSTERRLQLPHTR